LIVFSICSDQNLTQFCGFQGDKSERIAFFQSDFMGMSVTILFAIRKESKLSFCFRKKERRRGSFGAVVRQLYNIDGGGLCPPFFPFLRPVKPTLSLFTFINYKYTIFIIH